MILNGSKEKYLKIFFWLMRKSSIFLTYSLKSDLEFTYGGRLMHFLVMSIVYPIFFFSIESYINEADFIRGPS